MSRVWQYRRAEFTNEINKIKALWGEERMSIVRLSVLKHTAYAPDRSGNLQPGAYNRRQKQGRMEELREPTFAAKNSHLHHYLSSNLEQTTKDLKKTEPVVVMVHGFLFDPKQAVSPEPEETDNPHGRVYHFKDGDEREEQRHHTSSWPRHLGFRENDATGATGTVIAFGWHSQPGFASSLIDHFQNFYARAYDNAGLSAWVLLNVLHICMTLLPNRPLHVFCHSLGSRVVVRALALAAKYDRTDILERLGQVVVLGGSEYVVEAQLMHRRLDDLKLANRPAVYNVVSRENDVLDKLGENFGPRTFGNTQVIGHNGLDVETRSPHWIDLQIDSKKLQEWMSGRGFEVSGDRPGNVWDHWYYYTHRGNMALYNDIIRQPASWVIAALRAPEIAIPDGVSKRWSFFGD